VASVIAWLRDDLRLDDNPALAASLATGLPVVILYIWAPGELGPEVPRGAARWWLYNALEDLDGEVRKRGSGIVFITGDDTCECLCKAARECGAGKIFWNRRYSPIAAKLDETIKHKLKSEKIEVVEKNAALLRDPAEMMHKGQPYKVFTAYYKAAAKIPIREVSPNAPASFDVPCLWPKGSSLDGLGLAHSRSWTEALEKFWVPTFEGLNNLLLNLSKIVPEYDKHRDMPGKDETSRLSPYLRFGQIGPSQIKKLLDGLPESTGKECFIKELHWREFAYHIMDNFRDLPNTELNPKFAKMRWREDGAALAAWERGMTGYPIVDAGMRQLWKTGWMHNRLRMITGSFLVKDLLIDWKKGAQWFMDTLVDADVANNTLGWQWVAGCGPDAAPYFRIFNPVLQSRKFDPYGYYIRRYVPELAYLPPEWIHCPWKAPENVLEKAGIELGHNYPMPIVDHKIARKRALTALKEASQT
jgi:deoxyribodipyrimidine photo-lyase